MPLAFTQEDFLVFGLPAKLSFCLICIMYDFMFQSSPKTKLLDLCELICNLAIYV